MWLGNQLGHPEKQIILKEDSDFFPFCDFFSPFYARLFSPPLAYLQADSTDYTTSMILDGMNLNLLIQHVRKVDSSTVFLL